MPFCSACGAALPVSARFCPACAAPAESVAPEAPTELAPEEGLPTPTPTPGRAAGRPRSAAAADYDEGRFLPGTVLGGRYRIGGVVGRGGMGEVYRADDLKLGQRVALKFLPETAERDEEWLARFLNEVRVARQISHPGICRVHDVGEVDGHHFLSMELIDGEDLGSLLRRIGRLPQDKAVQIARQICTGLAAAHEQGVLHRDLKPANVMIDGRGNAKITDFGLAGAADTLSKEDVFSGTPAYMAPEQLAGREVTRKSDIYALGLVLYQLFTGRLAFEGGTPQEISRVRETSRPADPATLIDGLDPSVGDVILRCLERDPRSRPESALAVAAALPGGDPLAAALAAGVTPSPEIVAAAGEEGVLSPRRATVLLAVTGLAILAVAALSGRYQVTAVVPLDKPRDVLIDRARETLEELGTGPEGITDSAFGFDVDTDLRAWLAATDAHDPWELLPRGRPALVRFWYRSSPRRLQPQIAPSRVSWSDPPRTVSGMTAVRLDTLGRLVELERLPPQVAGPEAASVARGDPEWEKLLAAAGLDPSTLRPADPVWSPPFFTDRRAAWVGEIPELPGEEVRVEAAAFQGELVWFRLIGPWTRAERDQGSRVTTAARINQVLGISIFLLVSAIAAWAARRSIRAGRGDLQGATRIALALVVVHLIRWVLVSHHTGHIGAEFGMFVTTSGVWLFQVATVWVLYVALEPYVRRHDPQKIVAWARLLAGRWRDPLVGRDVLVGAAIAALLAVAILGVIPAKLALGGSPLPFPTWTSIFGGPRYALGNLADLLPNALTGGMFFTFLWLLLYRVARRPWAASVIVVLILATQMATQDPTVLGIGLAAVMAVAFVAVLARFGLLAVVSLGGFVTGLANAPLSLDLSQWQVRGGWLVVAALIAIAIAAWRASQGDRPGAAAGAGR